MATTGKIQIVNRQRDQKTFELPELGPDGEPKRAAGGRMIMQKITLGSTDDEGEENAVQPEIVVDGATWDRLASQRAIRGMIEARQIAIHPVA
jgi:hypothetical protein